MTRKEEIEKASVDYQTSKHPMAIGGDAFADTIYKMNINPSFIAGAEWADKTMIDKVCEFLENNMHDYFDDDNEFAVCDCFLTKENFIKQLKKEMEGIL